MAPPSLDILNALTRGRGRLHWTDWMSYLYLLAGVVVMFGPVLWLVMSSFKSEAEAPFEFPPRLLPYGRSGIARVPGTRSRSPSTEGVTAGDTTPGTSSPR